MDKINNTLQILRDGLKSDFAKAVYEDERFTEVLHEIASDFAVEHLPFDEVGDTQVELALMLLDSLRVSTY